MATKYEQKNDIQHILTRSDNYISGIQPMIKDLWYFNDESKKFVITKNVSFVQALNELIKEITSNSLDNAEVSRSKNIEMKYIDVTFDKSNGMIIVENDGNFISTKITDFEYLDPVTQKVTYNRLYPAQLIFSHFRTGSNFDDDEKKISAGKNGAGAKITNVFSKYFEVEHSDPVEKQILKLVFRDNLSIRESPVITNFKSTKVQPFTKVSFIPDYERFQIKLNQDSLSHIEKQIEKMCYDLSYLSKMKITFGAINSGVTIPKEIKVKDFLGYASLYFKSKNYIEITTEDSHVIFVEVLPEDRSILENYDSGLYNVSFVNGLSVTKGVHVDKWKAAMVTDVIAKYNELHENVIDTKKKSTSKTTTDSSFSDKENTPKKDPNFVKLKTSDWYPYVAIFISCRFTCKPTYTNQSKEELRNPSPTIRKLTPEELKVVLAKWKSLDEIEQIKQGKVKEKIIKELSEESLDPEYISSNYTKANLCSKYPKDCTLRIVEGLSPKTLADSMSNYLEGGSDFNGTLAIKGKIINVLKNDEEKLAANKELKLIELALGISPELDFALEENQKKIKYGKVLFMADQDEDGKNIRSLLANLFINRYKNLWELNCIEFGIESTPVVKIWFNPVDAKTKPSNLNFYNTTVYKNWCNSPEYRSHYPKYVKGLSAFSQRQVPELCENRKEVTFLTPKQEDKNCIDLIFGPKNEDRRKEWILTSLDGNQEELENIVYDGEHEINEYVNKEMLSYVCYDLSRHIPSVMDCFVVVDRKILFGMKELKITTPQKVFTISGEVMKKTRYHHGDSSMNMAITNKGMGFVGSNNVPLLENRGIFGSRAYGGSDFGSARYIETCLEKITEYIFRKEDDEILEYVIEDETSVEPTFYVPVIPFLCNGYQGISTGFSTTIPPVNILDLIKWTKNRIDSDKYEKVELYPWWRNFNGPVIHNRIKCGTRTYVETTTKGIMNHLGDGEYEITELPVALWTEDLIRHLDEMSVKQEGQKYALIDSYSMYNTANTVHVKFVSKDYNHQIDNKNWNFMTKTKKYTNMYMLDINGRPKRYDLLEDICEDYFDVRHSFYIKRKSHILAKLKNELKYLLNKKRFVELVKDGTIQIRNKNLNEKLEELKFDKKKISKDNENTNYEYLRSMRIDNIYDDEYYSENIEKKIASIELEIKQLDESSIEDIWLRELNELENFYINKFLVERCDDTPKNKNTKKKTLTKSAKTTKSKVVV